MNTKQITSIIIALVLVAGLSFYGGMTYGKSSGPGRAGGQFGMGGRLAGGSSGMTGGFISGEILAKDATSITIKMRDGSSKIVFYSTSTDVQKTIGGSAEDLGVGKQVSVTGSANPDGSITAQAVQLRTTPLIPSQGRLNQ